MGTSVYRDGFGRLVRGSAAGCGGGGGSGLLVEEHMYNYSQWEALVLDSICRGFNRQFLAVHQSAYLLPLALANSWVLLS